MAVWFYTDTEMEAEREKCRNLEQFLERLGAKQTKPGRWEFNNTTAELLDEKLCRAERALKRAGWTLVEGAQEWRPPRGGVAPELIRTLEEIERAEPITPGGDVLLKPLGVKAIREGLDSLRAAKPPRCLDTVDWLNGEVLDLMRKIARPDYLTYDESEVIRRAVAAVDLLAAAGDQMNAPRVLTAEPNVIRSEDETPDIAQAAMKVVAEMTGRGFPPEMIRANIPRAVEHARVTFAEARRQMAEQGR